MQINDSPDQSYSGRLTVGQFILHVIQGILIGGGAIIPGVSGGVLCVAFGIYKPMMAMIAHPFRTFRIYYKLFIPIIIGGGIGFIGLANVVTLLFEKSPSIAYCLFVGLVAGTLPSLFKEAGKKGTTIGSWTGFTISLFLIFGVLAFLKTGISMSINPNSWWYLFSGGLWGLSLVIPGLSSSSILVFMGLYEPMAAGIGVFNLSVIIPVFIGIASIVVVLARLVNYIYERYYSLVSHIILGIVIASTLLIIPKEFTGALDVILSLICFAIGFIVAWGMDKFGDKVKM